MPSAPPRTPPSSKRPRPIDEQISSAISSGFSTVINDLRAQNAEMLSALRDIQRTNAVLATTQRDAAVRTGEVGARQRMQKAQSRVQSAHEMASEAMEKPIPVGMSGQMLVDSPVGRREFKGWRAEADNTREDIRSRVYNAVEGRAERWTVKPLGDIGGTTMRPKEGYSKDSSGRWRGPNGGFVKEMDAYERISYAPDVKVDSNGRFRRGGKFISATDAGVKTVEDGLMDQVGRRQALAKSVTTAADAWKNGEPIGRALMNMAPQGLIKAGGVVTIAGLAANKAWEGVQSQYAKNREFQEYYGGSNAAQFGERGSQWWNKNVRGRFSLLGGDSYDTLFTQAMQMGMRGGERSDYINNAANLMKKGVSAEQAGSLMKMTIESGGAAKSIKALSDAIGDINKTARDAGVSAKAARDIFESNYRASTSVMLGDTPSAIRQAQAYTTSQVSMGQAYSENVSYSGMVTGSSMQRRTATLLGMSLPEYLEMTRKQGALPGMDAQETFLRERLNQLPNGETGETVQQVVDRFMKGIKGDYVPEYHSIGLGNALEDAGFDRYQINAILGSSGIQSTPELALGVAANLYTGNAPSQLIAKQDDAASKRFKSKPKQPFEMGQRLSKDFDDWSRTMDVQEGWDDALAKIYGYESRVDREVTTAEMELLQNVGKFGISPDTKVRIVSGGKERVVTMAEAMDKYRDQINNGSAMVVEGDSDGQSVSQLLGMPKSITDQAAPTMSSGDPNVGQDLAEFQKNKPKDDKNDGASTNVVIDLKPRVAEIFDIYLSSKYTSPGPTPAGT